MNNPLPGQITRAGGIFILLSGVLNTILGLKIGAVYYYPYPGGKMGHVGILAGLAAILIGALIIVGIPRLINHGNKRVRILGSILTVFSAIWALYLAPCTLARSAYFCATWGGSGCWWPRSGINQTPSPRVDILLNP